MTYGAGDGPVSVAIGDLDGDGDADLAVANYNSGNVSILLNHGGGMFADLDGDGDADLAVANALSDNVSILLNHGDGTFADDVTYGVRDGPLSVAIDDLDGDGDADLAVANHNSNNVSILLNHGDGTFAEHVTYRAAVEADPKLAKAWFNLGVCLSGKADATDDPEQKAALREEAIQAYRAAVEADPKLAKAWCNLAGSLCEKAVATLEETPRGQLLEKGITAGRQAVALGGERYNLACALALARRADEALTGLAESLAKGEVAWQDVARDSDWDDLRRESGQPCTPAAGDPCAGTRASQSADRHNHNRGPALRASKQFLPATAGAHRHAPVPSL